MIAALFVATGGAYFGMPDRVDPWDITRDARKYNGPHPVVAHPPCERWGRYWSGGPSAKVRRELGDRRDGAACGVRAGSARGVVMVEATERALKRTSHYFVMFARIGRWGTCVACPRDVHHVVYPEFCAHTDRYDHHLTVKDLAEMFEHSRLTNGG